MAAYLLQVKHHFCQIFIPYFPSSALVGNGPILTEDATQIAVREKDGARAMLSHQGYLLPEVGLGAIDHHLRRGLAESFFALQPIHATLPGTELARLENGVGLFNPPRQLTLFLQNVIGGSPWGLVFFTGVKRDGRTEKGAAKDEGIFDEVPPR
jgi:hypothetical protein